MVWFVECISIATCKGLFQIPGIVLMAAGWSGFCMSDKWSWIHSLKTVANTVTELTVKSAFLIWHAVIGFTTWHWFNFRGVNCLGGGGGKLSTTHTWICSTHCSQEPSTNLWTTRKRTALHLYLGKKAQPKCFNETGTLSSKDLLCFSIELIAVNAKYMTLPNQSYLENFL